MKANQKLSDLVFLFCLISGILLFIYVALRAWYVPATHDESFSWNEIAPHRVMEIISYNTDSGGMPNNHILNTLLMKFFAWVFGASIFSVRLPNVLGYLLFLLYSYKICKKLNQPLLQISGFLLLSLNPYLLEFFGIARGYGIANGLLLASCYYLLTWNEHFAPKYLKLSLVFCSLAVLSNFSVFQVYLSLILVINFVFLIKSDSKINTLKLFFKYFARKNIYPFINTLILFLILFEPFRKILQWHETYGGINGFWQDSVKGLTSAFCYNQSYGNILWSSLSFFVIFSLIFILLAICRAVIRKVYSENVILCGLLLILPVIAHILDHYFFGVEFLVPRAGQYFYVLFILALLFTFNFLKNKYTIFTLAVLVALSTTHLILSLNLKKSVEWPYDAGNKQAIECFDSIHATDTAADLSVGITWIFEPGLNFYRTTGKRTWLNKFTREGIEKKEYDIYYVQAADTAFLLGKGKIFLKKFPVSDSYIIK